MEQKIKATPKQMGLIKALAESLLGKELEGNQHYSIEEINFHTNANGYPIIWEFDIETASNAIEFLQSQTAE